MQTILNFFLSCSVNVHTVWSLSPKNGVKHNGGSKSKPLNWGGGPKITSTNYTFFSLMFYPHTGTLI